MAKGKNWQLSVQATLAAYLLQNPQARKPFRGPASKTFFRTEALSEFTP